MKKGTMTEKQIAVFNELLSNADFKGKETLRHILWLNTVAPKFEIGDTVTFRANGAERIWGIPLRRAVGKVVEKYAFKTDDRYYYRVECTFEKDGKQYTTTIPCCEDNTVKADKLIINTDWS